MIHVRIWTFGCALALAGALLAATPLRAQDPPAPQPDETAPVRVPLPGDDAQREMEELFGKVERQLRDIDRLLQEAARATPSGASELAGMLRDAQASGENVKQGIDRILELAASQRPPPSSGGSGQGQPQPGEGQGGSPLDRQGEQSTGRESTPSTPEPGGTQPDGKQPGGEKPEPGGEKPDPAQGGRENPDSPTGSQTDPEQRPGGPPKTGQTGAGGNPVDGRDRWGDLPTHAREVFRNEGGRDMPPVYREWIDAYYKRLNKKP